MIGSHSTRCVALETGRPKKSVNVDARARDDRHLLVAEEHHVAGVAEDGRNVGRDEELAVAEPDDDRRAVADRDDLLGIVGRDQHEREQAAHQQQRPADGVLEAVVLHLALDEVRDDLGVGLGDELVSLPLQLLLQVEVVLDDAVVDDDDLAGAVAVRMGVLLGRPAVGRPARVADAVVAGDRLGVDARPRGSTACRRCAAGRPRRRARPRRRPSRSRDIRAAAVRRSGPERRPSVRCIR